MFHIATPPPPASIDLRCCDVVEMLADARDARLIVADPPWQYSEAPGVANPEVNGIYDGLPDSVIAYHLDLAYGSAGKACRLAVWYTFPKDAEWDAAGRAGERWGPIKTGGAWLKTGQVGVGYHWRGQVEPVAVFTRGSTGRCRELLLNGHQSPPSDHSEKPIEWLRAWVRAWTDPGDLVVDLYAGLAPSARACLIEGRRYLGAEIDPARHAEALARLAQVRA
jgi:hypothetical protein